MFKFLEKYSDDTTTDNMSDIDYLTYLIMVGDISASEVIEIARQSDNRIDLGNGCIVKQNRINTWEVEFPADGYRDSMGLELFLVISRQNIIDKME